MRILLAVPRSFNPKQMYREYPLGVGFLGTILSRGGHEVRLYDENVEVSQGWSLVDEMEKFHPDIVGFSIITPNYPVARRQIRAIKAGYPAMRILAGGVHTSLFPEDIIADGADVVVRGEGEGVIAEIVDGLQRGEMPGARQGVVYRGADGKVTGEGSWAPRWGEMDWPNAR